MMTPMEAVEAARAAQFAIICDGKDEVVRRTLANEEFPVIAYTVGQKCPEFLDEVGRTASKGDLVCLHYGPTDPRE